MHFVDAWRMARLRIGSGAHTGVASIRPRSLGGAEVLLRRGTTDAEVAAQTLVHLYHVPPDGLHPKVVWDLGSNIGLTVAHYACLFPHARIIGVEPDPANAALATRNIRHWSDRCKILECAVWHEDDELPFERASGREWAGHIEQADPRDAAALRVRARSLNALLEDEPIVDFLKMDIEGAEQEVLRRNTEWASKVRCIKVEVHEPYATDQCVDDLQRLGFTTTVDPDFWVSIVGIKA